MEDKLNELSFLNALIFGIIIAASYYILFYQATDPKTVIPALDQNISTLKVEIDKLDAQIKKGLELRQEMDAMEVKAEKIYKYIPENLSSEQASSAVSEEARIAGLSIQSIRTGPTWLDKETISEGTVSVDVLGDFSQIMIFLSELTRKDVIFAVNKVQIKDRASNEENGLSLTAQISYFRRFKKIEAKR